MKKTILTSLLGLVFVATSLAQIDIIIVAAPGDPAWITDVEAKIESTGDINADFFNSGTGTPTLATLITYDAAFVFTDSNVSDPAGLGNILAQYIEGGFGVVDATFTPNVTIGGNWTNYQLYSGGGQSTGTNLMLGNVLEPQDLLVRNVSSFDGGTSSFHNTGGTVANGTTIVAEWSDGEPLIISQENVGPANVRRVFLNFYPPSEDA